MLRKNQLSSFYSPFCVLAKVTKLVGLKSKGGLSPTNLVTFAVTQNGGLSLLHSLFLRTTKMVLGRFENNQHN